jgi:hypothetical protein
MTPDEIEGVQQAFSASLEPVMKELRAIREELHNIDDRLVHVEGHLDGVEILVRRKMG